MLLNTKRDLLIRWQRAGTYLSEVLPAGESTEVRLSGDCESVQVRFI